MHKTLLPFANVPQLAKTDVAYSTGDPRLRPFYEYEPSLDSFAAAIAEKSKGNFPRQTLVEVLQEQYAALPVQEKVRDNIAGLLSSDTFTVATAHQPSLFLGPLYFLYKALTTIQLAEAAQARNPGKRIVPVFVLGSEDHDLEELNSINLFGKKLVWHSEEKGAVGSMSTAGLRLILIELKSLLGESPAAGALFERVKTAYTGSATIAQATRALLHDLFGSYGLVVADLNNVRLKRHFIPVIKAELQEQPCFSIVNTTITQLNALGFKTQAAPREINLFYMLPGMRERIVADGAPGNTFSVLNTDLTFSPDEMLAEVDAHPERFSPNVVLRPLLQEMILPNLAYVGGGGELAYWLERKALFQHFGVQFPVLVRRHSVLWLDRDAVRKRNKAGFSAEQLFADTDALLRLFVEIQAGGEVDLEAELADLKSIFDRLAAKAAAVDPTLEKAVRADEVKAAGSLEQWQSRLVRAEKQKHEVAINQIRSLKEKLFPGNGLQERHDNFMPFLLKYGDSFIQTLKDHLQPFDAGFVVLEEEA